MLSQNLQSTGIHINKPGLESLITEVINTSFPLALPSLLKNIRIFAFKWHKLLRQWSTKWSLIFNSLLGVPSNQWKGDSMYSAVVEMDTDIAYATRVWGYYNLGRAYGAYGDFYIKTIFACPRKCHVSSYFIIPVFPLIRFYSILNKSNSQKLLQDLYQWS